MKKIIFAFLIIAIASYCTSIKNNYTNADCEYYYTYNVEHLFTHCLIAYPEIAFKSGNTMKKNYDADCITPREFNLILESLHKNDYVLVDIHNCFTQDGDTIIKQKVKVPKGKYPIILSFDDVNYDHKKQGLGMVDKIIIDNNNNIATQTNINGKIDISYDNEFVTILEGFIKQHPDFSPFGAKGTINLTGYDGVLGYRTSHTNTNNQKKEFEDAKKVIEKLKYLGWTFACHSYGHYHMKKISNEKFADDIHKWKNEVEPLVGKTSVYVYPYGEWEVFDGENYCQKHKILTDGGFKLFCGVGMKTFFAYLPSKSNKKVLFMDRKAIDGTTLKSNNENLIKFFNPLAVLDSARFV